MEEDPEVAGYLEVDRTVVERAIRLINGMHACQAQGQEAAARRLRDGAPEEVAIVAESLIRFGPRHWFEHPDELRALYVTATDPEERARQEAELEQALARVWKDFNAQE